MNVAFLIAKRYLFSKKSHNAINVISGISVCGVALATLAMVCTLSVFNGFRDLVKSMFTSFDPELKVTSLTGKTFNPQESELRTLGMLDEIELISSSLEDQVMLKYKNRQTMAVLKGVESNFRKLTPIDGILYGRGDATLHTTNFEYVIPGMGLISTLDCGLHFVDALTVFAPKPGAKVNVARPGNAFNSADVFSTGLAFMVNQQKYDDSYLLTSLEFAQSLLNQEGLVSSVGIKLKPGTNVNHTKQKIRRILGEAYLVSDRYEQQVETFNIMRVEKLISYIFLLFILLISCFNIVSSLSMLMIDKRADAATLRCMGADHSLMARIFIIEGWLISLVGAVVGITLGLLLCLLQQHFGLITLGEQFVVNNYPVSVRVADIVLVFVTALIVGFFAAWYPVRRIVDSLSGS